MIFRVALRNGDPLIPSVMDGWTDGQDDIQSCMYATKNRVEELRSRGAEELRNGDPLIPSVMDGWTDGQDNIQSCMYATKNRVEELSN